MRTVNLYEAKTHLSELVDAALEVEEIEIARRGRPLVRFTPVVATRRSDGFGRFAGLFTISDDFNDTPADFDDYV